MDLEKVKNLQKQLKEILNTWDFIGGVPEDEYDCLRDKIISQLQKDSQPQTLKKVLTDEITGHFGINIIPKMNLDQKIDIILNWWNTQKV